MTHELDQIAPALAKWLAPYIAAELGLAGPNAAPSLSADYDFHTCEVFASGLGDPVLPRAEWFFRYLGGMANAADDDERRLALNSVDLARTLELSSPRDIASVLTNSLKRRAKKLGLPCPWIQNNEGPRTTWIARDVAEAVSLSAAIQTERERRGLPNLFPASSEEAS
jgi:hypothetical protein